MRRSFGFRDFAFAALLRRFLGLERVFLEYSSARPRALDIFRAHAALVKDALCGWHHETFFLSRIVGGGAVRIGVGRDGLLLRGIFLFRSGRWFFPFRFRLA